MTAEDVVKRHLREMAGISGAYGDWRYCREDAARKRLGENLSLNVDYAIFVTAGVASLFLGSTTLDEELESEVQHCCDAKVASINSIVRDNAGSRPVCLMNKFVVL